MMFFLWIYLSRIHDTYSTTNNGPAQTYAALLLLVSQSGYIKFLLWKNLGLIEGL